MKVIESLRCYTSREAGQSIGRSSQTINNWDKYSVELEEQGKERLIPKPLRIPRTNHRHWNLEQIEELKRFRDNMEFGDMAEYNRRLRGNKIG